MKKLHLAAAAALAAGCATTPKAGPGSAAVTGDAAAGVSDAALADLLRRHWAWSLEHDPVFATRLGVHAYDDRIADNAPAAIEAARARQKEWVAEAEARVAKGGLGAADAVTLKLFAEQARDEVATAACRYEEWNLSPRENPVTEWNELVQLHAVVTPNDGENLVARYRLAPAHIDNEVAALRRGAAAGLFANRETVGKLIQVLKAQLAQPIEEWPMLSPAKEARRDWSDADRAKLAAGLREVVEKGVKPALGRYLAAVEAEIAPQARDDDHVGLGALPLGAACYTAEIRRHTSLERAPKEIHEIGLAEIARIDGELEALGAKLFGTRTLAAALEKLRTDRSLYFGTSEEVESKAAEALTRAKSKLDGFFGVKPVADCVIVRVPDYEAPFTTIAYYREPVPDGSRPGEYFVNVYQPETRPKYEAEALAFHEAVPGHHLQIAIAQQLSALPAFRRHTGQTAFVEGWGLYAESLAEDMGLYSGDLDRMGKLSYEAWRASRLVVDTGMHAMGWSRQRAVEFMLAHTALARNNIENEVDRYITTPGQALAYKTGQLEMLRLREEARRALGAKFDLAGFHDALLSGGAVSLSVLADQIAAWVEARKRAG